MSMMRSVMAGVIFFASVLTVSVGLAAKPEERVKGPKLGFSDTKRKRGPDAIKAIGNRMSEVARHHGMSQERLKDMIEKDHDLWVTEDSDLLYICEGLDCPDHAPAEQAPSTNGINSSFDVPYPLTQTFLLHSKPGATKTIFLDFNGHTVSNSVWENGGNLKLDAYYSDLNSSTVKTEIQGIWARVAEDFAPFDVDVTTEDPGTEALRKVGTGDTQWGIRACFTKNKNLLTGNAIINAGGGGTAYYNSFSWSTDEPALIFNTGLYTGSQTASHEIGHTLNLTHMGSTPSTEYYGGHGSGSTSWAPIMGASWLGNDEVVVQWTKGEYYLANNTQDELNVITTQNGFGYQTDDHGNTNSTATSLTASGNVFTVRGIIEQRSDVDVFSFTVITGGVTITVSPYTPAPNVDLRASLFNAAGSLLAESNPAGTLTASLSTTLVAGTYYLHVANAADGNPLASTPTGYTSYGSLGQYAVTIQNGQTVNQPPVAFPQSITTAEDTPTTITLTGSDPEGSNLTYAVVANPIFGTISTGTGAMRTYTPAANYNGTDSFTFSVNDGLTNSAAATVSITITAVNDAPACALTAPTTGATYFAPASIAFTATATDVDGTITQVEFFNGATLLGVDTTSPYAYSWNNVTEGSYTLTAKATDNSGAVTTSAGASVTVTLATYTVTYDANGATGGAVPAAQTKTNGVALTLATNSGNLVRPGYILTGWNTASDGSGTSYAVGASYTSESSVTLYATWQANGIVQPLPFDEGFETTTVELGDLNGQNNWVVSAAGAALVQTDEKYAGDRALKINAANTVSVSQALTSTASVVWLDLMQQVVAGQIPATRPDAAAAFLFDANGRLLVCDGVQSPGAEWVTLSNHTPMAAGDWVRLTARADYSAQTWDLYLNGTNVAENLGFATTRTGLGGIRIEAKAAVVDEVHVGTSSPFGPGANNPPTCALTSPTNGANFTAPTTITLTADASDADGMIAKVEFFNGTTLLGEDTTSPFQYDLSVGVAGGSYTLTATATDNAGAAHTSAAVNVTVSPALYAVEYDANGATGGSVPASQTQTNGTALTLASNSGSLVRAGYTFIGWNTASDGSGTVYAESASYSANAAVTLYAEWNQNPTCAITSPTNGASVTAPASILIEADASDTDGTITQVAFFNGTTHLGTAVSLPYQFDWTDVGAGVYTLTAQATDDEGATHTSATVTLTVIEAAVSNDLHFVEGFETNTVSLGDLNGQNNWTVSAAGTAWVQTNASFAGERALKIDAQGPVSVSQALTTTASVVWLDVMQQVVGGATPTARPNAAAAFRFDTHGRLAVFDGLQAAGSEWVTLTNHTPIAEGAWTRLTAKADYAAQTWVIYLNGTNVAENLGFATNRTSLSGLSIQSQSGVFDDVYVGLIRPAGLVDVSGSAQANVAPTSWYLEHFKNVRYLDDDDPDGDGMTNLEEFRAGSKPNDPTSSLRIMETTANPANANGFVIRWQSVDGKVYTLKSATSLAGAFDMIVAENIPATPPLNTFTDTVERAGMKFYRVLLQE